MNRERDIAQQLEGGCATALPSLIVVYDSTVQVECSKLRPSIAEEIARSSWRAVTTCGGLTFVYDGSLVTHNRKRVTGTQIRLLANERKEGRRTTEDILLH